MSLTPQFGAIVPSQVQQLLNSNYLSFTDYDSAKTGIVNKAKELENGLSGASVLGNNMDIYSNVLALYSNGSTRYSEVILDDDYLILSNYLMV